MDSYIIASTKEFHFSLFNSLKDELKGNWYFIRSAEELDYEKIKALNPKYIFFLHWSEKIAESIYSGFNCVVFHMTDLPYGRGGSPLQNLIVRGHTETMLSAIKVVEALDAGDVYMKKKLRLDGTAQEIFLRAADLMHLMIREIIEAAPEPVPQQGKAEVFRRRKPSESNLESIKDPKSLYDHIRMLDADGYPKAFIENDHFKFEFTNAKLNPDNTLSADVRILKK
jgi:methionyl-tRNA formyltransferase